MKNKKLLMLFLAVNSLTASYAATSTSEGKYEKVYSNMVGNIEAGKSNEENYHLLEKVLNERNKELRDLYNQSDYIVKPEYLEWQIFASASYNHKSKGDNTSKNAKYHSDPKKVNGKQYLQLREPRQVDLGIYIPERTIRKNPIELELVNPPEIVIDSLDVNPNVNPSVTPGAQTGSYSESTPNVSPFDAFLESYENTFSTTANSAEKTNGSSELIGGVTPSSYHIEYSVDTDYNITADKVIDSFGNGLSVGDGVAFDNGDSMVTNIDATATPLANIIANGIQTGYTTPANAPGFYSGGSRVINVFGGTGGTVSNTKILDLKGPLSFGMVAEGGSKELVNNAGSRIQDNAENTDENTSGMSNSWYNNNIQHVGENVAYTLSLNGNPIRYNSINQEHLDVLVNGKIVYRHDGVIQAPVNATLGTQVAGADTYTLTSSTTSYLGGYTGYKVGMSIINNNNPSGTKLTNNGTIAFNGWSTIGMYTAAKGGLSDVQMTNNGTIEITNGIYYSDSNFGMKIDGIINNDSANAPRAMLNNGTININLGAGMALVRGSTGEGFIENATTGLITVTNGTGIYLAPTNSVKTEDAINNGTITLSARSTGMAAVADTGANTVRVINNGILNINGTSIGLTANGVKTEAINESTGVLNFQDADNTGFYAVNGGKVINNASSLNSTSSSTAMFVIKGATSSGVNNNGNMSLTGANSTAIYNEGNFTSTGNITVTGANSQGIYNTGTLTSTGNITVNGTNAVAVYSGAAVSTNIISDNVSVTGGTTGAAFYTNGGKINIAPATTNGTTTVTASGAGTYIFYDESYKGTSVPNQTFVINGNLTATAQNGAIAFDFKNTTNSIMDFLNNNLLDIQSGTTTINVGDTAFSAKNSTISIDEVSKIATTGGLTGGSVVLKGSDVFYALGSTINIDQNSNLDLATTTDTYGKNQSHIDNSNINLISGMTIIGTGPSQYGIGQENHLGSLVSDVKLSNAGDINLSGSGTTGIYGAYSTINNSGNIIVGDAGAGIFSSNSSLAVNTGNINFGNGSIGIYGINNYASSVGASKNKIDLTMSSGTLTANGTTEGYGIYANNYTNNTGLGLSNINFTGGTIDMSNIIAADRAKAIAIASTNTTLNSSGNINTAENGIVIYSNGGVTNVTGGTINLNKDNSIGLVLKNIGSGNFTGSGATFNIDGDGIALFLLKDSLNITDTFTTNIASGSNYRYADMTNSSFTFDKSMSLENDINFIVADDSAVLLGTNSNVNSTGTGNIGVYAKNVAASAVLTSIGVTTEVTNKGTIDLGNTSVGIYADAGAGVLNDLGSFITVADNSQGIYAKNSGQITNNGAINIGEGSIGVFLNNATLTSAVNGLNGIIKSTSDNAVGIYSYQQNSEVINNGTIDLSGQSSIGIYDKGSASRIITNNGSIIIGDSSDPQTPSIGIYSEDTGITINHTSVATLTSGINSVGIYGKNSTLNIDGTVNTGNSGTGIYADSSSKVVIGASAKFNIGSTEATAVYASGNSTVDNYTTDIVYPGDSYAFILNGGSTLNNYANGIVLNNDNVLAYADNSNINNYGNINVTGKNTIALYGVNNSQIKNTAIIDAGAIQGSNVAIYAKDSNVINTGSIIMGDTVINDPYNPFSNEYAVAIYGERSNVLNDTGSYVSVGENSVGLYVLEGNAQNKGTITSTKNGVIGMFVAKGTGQNDGTIELYGNDSVGLAGKTNANLINTGTITVHGDNSIGIFANLNSTVDNRGTINVLGNNSDGIRLQGGSTLINSGTIYLGGGVQNSVKIGTSTGYDIPSIENAGIIKVAEKFEVPENLQISIKVTPNTLRVPTAAEIAADNYAPEDIDGKFLVSNAVRFEAAYFAATEPITILPDFTQYTNAAAYKLEDTFVPTTPNGGPNGGIVKVKSKSITWDAIPKVNDKGNIDIWMVKIPYDTFSNGLWYEDFGKALDSKYTTASAEGIKIFDKLDLVDNEADLRHLTASLAGNIYANINQREDDIAKTFENSLDLLQNSKNNTKENVKINIIGSKSSFEEKTDGVVGYDSSSVGVLALREVERTYKHTFGYSLGYLHTGFEFDDNNSSEEWVDTIQLGVHNKYNTDNWLIRNDLTGRASVHNVDRNIDWPESGRSEMNGTYETYSITSDNIIGKEIKLGKASSIMPYGGFRAMYVTRPTFEEDGLERLKVEGNDAWSAKPRAGIELKTEMPLGKRTAWKAKGTLDLAYEYELANLNERERASLVAVEDGYHNLSKPEEEKGQFRTRASIGVEVEDRYGVFLTGEYTAGENSQEEYRAGVSLKAVF